MVTMPKAIVYRVGQEPAIEEIASNLEANQAAVNGYIECIHLEDDFNPSDELVLVCNEEGKVQHLEPNRYVPALSDTIHGDFFVSRMNNGGERIDVESGDLERCRGKILPPPKWRTR